MWLSGKHRGFCNVTRKGPRPLKKLFLLKNRDYSSIGILTMSYIKAEEYLVASSLAATLDRPIKSMC